MRKRFETQLPLGQTPIETVHIPLTSRDELPPVLAALQWIFSSPQLKNRLFETLEKRIAQDKKNTGRQGMDLWHILVLGVVRLALDCDYDRLEYLVHYDGLLRSIMGLPPSPQGDFSKGFHHRTISENICHVDEELLQEINALLVTHGREILKKKPTEKIEVKTDSYVLETNVHFPTDLNLLWDASRKCIELLESLSEGLGLPGWRKAKNWKKQIKSQMRLCQQIKKGGGLHKEVRLRVCVEEYLRKAYDLEAKVNDSVRGIWEHALSLSQMIKVMQVEYFQEMLIKHIDLIDRRLLQGEKIPHEEKLFSLFEPHTEWINKGKTHPSVELGHKLLVSTDQYGLVLDYKVMDHPVDHVETLPLASRLLARYGEGTIRSISFDKGFSLTGDRELLELYIPEVMMLKKGRKSKVDQERESQKTFKKLRAQHSAVESDINALEHHGLDRCPDKGLKGYQRYVGLGIMAYNLHKIGRELLRQRQRKKAA